MRAAPTGGAFGGIVRRRPALSMLVVCVGGLLTLSMAASLAAPSAAVPETVAKPAWSIF